VRRDDDQLIRADHDAAQPDGIRDAGIDDTPIVQELHRAAVVCYLNYLGEVANVSGLK